MCSFGQDNSTNSSKDTNKNSGFFNITKVSFSAITSLKQERFIEGVGNIFSDLDAAGAHAWSVQTINGYFVSRYFSLGLGVGIDEYNSPNFKTLPLFLDLRGYFSDAEDSTYFYLDIGPNLSFGGADSDFKKGIAFNFGVGYKFKVGNRLFLVSDIFYSHKTVSLTNEGIGTSDDIIKVNGIGLSLGFIF